MRMPYFSMVWFWIALLTLGFVGSVVYPFFALELAKNNAAIASGEWWRLLTYSVVHYDFLHWFLNCYSLYQLYVALESRWQPLIINFVLVVSTFGAGIVSYFWTPQTAIGASGGVFGLMGLLLITALYLQKKELYNQIYTLILINLVIGVLASAYIDNAAHVGGLLTGVLLGALLLAKIKLYK